MEFSTGSQLPLAFVAGVLLHLMVFIRGEWHKKSPQLLALFAAVLVFLAVHEFRSAESEDGLTSRIFALLAGLYTSILAYRLCFHPLRRFPGPFWARTSKFWHVYHCLNRRQHAMMHSLYQKYGSFVRTGPNELMIVRPHIHTDLDGPGSRCVKPDWYDMLDPIRSLISERSFDIHDRRRKVWEQALNPKALNTYLPIILSHVRALTSNIEEAAASSELVNVNNMMYWFALDTIGDLALGRSFETQKHKVWHPSTAKMRRGMTLLAPLSPVPWLARIGFTFMPFLSIVRDWFGMQDELITRIESRAGSDSDRNDVLSHFLRVMLEENFNDADHHWLHGDGITAIIAGSETTAVTLIFLMYELSARPDLVKGIRREIDVLDIESAAALKGAQVLDAAIKETLRLHPPLPSAGYRQTPPEGIFVDETYIPGNVKIIAPRYTVSRLNECFEYPESYLPERWLNDSDLIKMQGAYNPFAIGRYSCVGRHLAMDEIRLAAASILARFDLERDSRIDYRKVEDEMTDQMAACPGIFELRFRLRETV